MHGLGCGGSTGVAAGLGGLEGVGVWGQGWGRDMLVGGMGIGGFGGWWVEGWGLLTGSKGDGV